MRNFKKIEGNFTLVEKIKSKLRIFLCKMPVFNVHFEQHFLRISINFVHRAGANDQSYHQ